MVWSNWQGAIWRGAMLVVLFWAGLAWTQAPAQRPADPGERIFKVTENGVTTRCRVLESWQLPDGRVAHYLEALETGEKVTIVDEQPPTPGPSLTHPREMPKRIWVWGKGSRTPPAGSPLPPHMRLDSGVIRNLESAPPSDAVTAPGPIIVNRVVDDRAIGGTCADGCQPMLPARGEPNLFSRLFPRREAAFEQPHNPQVIQYQEPMPGVPPLMPPANPIIRTEGSATEAGPQTNPPYSTAPSVSATEGPALAPRDTRMPIIHQWLIGERGPTIVQQRPIHSSDVGQPELPPSPTVAPIGVKPSVEIAGPQPVGPAVLNPSRPVETVVRKPWRPGDKLFGWLQGKSAASPAKTDAAKSDEARKLKQTEDLLAQQNKLAEKKLADNVEKIYKQPFSTAIANTQLPAKPPEAKKPVPAPLAMTGGTEPGVEKVGVLPPPTGGVKPASTSPADKRDPWGVLGSSEKPLPPGRSLFEMGPVNPEMVKLPPPPERKNDPLMAPERLLPSEDKLRPKGILPPPVARNTSDPYEVPPSPGGNIAPAAVQPMGPAKYESSWPLGTQSIQAAKSGLLGPVTFVPVPMATVPQPNHPPMPPPPNMPDAPQLNAYVNAFTPPPNPKGAAQMPTQAMNPYAYPTPQQQMMMMQMYAQQQQLAQQQMLMQYGYRPTPAMMNPSAYGPAMANYSRQYAGPQAPNPFAANPAVQTGYAPAPYPPMMSAPYGPMVQPVSYQPTAQQAAVQQVEQLIRVLRESQYPSQRESAAQSLASYEWRAHPQIVPALVASASQDPAASVRAGCVMCLGRMNAAVEPVFGALHALRNDIDPRVRSSVEQAFVNLGQAPMAPQ